MKRTIVTVLALSAIAAGASAQQAGVIEEQQKMAFERQAQAAVVVGKMTAAVETRVTKGAPYSGEAVTESIQTLGDGNRIVRKTVVRMYRDSEGRTRREQVSVDPMTGAETTTVSITDPTTGSSFVLNPQEMTAQRTNAVYARVASPRASSAPAGTAQFEVREDPAGERVAQIRETEARARVALTQTSQEASAALRRGVEIAVAGQGETTKEDLGQATVGGVLANGTRTTTVIPAGAIGNEQPIHIVSEQWFSPELQLLVQTRHSDPRVGETRYQLLNVNRAEQNRSLFEVPAGYTIKEGGGVFRMLRDR